MIGTQGQISPELGNGEVTGYLRSPPSPQDEASPPITIAYVPEIEPTLQLETRLIVATESWAQLGAANQP